MRHIVKSITAEDTFIFTTIMNIYKNLENKQLFEYHSN